MSKYKSTHTGQQIDQYLDEGHQALSKANSSVASIDSSTTSTHAHIIAETHEGNEVTTAIPPATTTNAGVMTAADKAKLNGSASNETLEILAVNFEERLTGTSASSSAYTDPHLFVSSVTTWALLNSYLNAIGNSGQPDEKNTGWLEFHINGVPIKVLCQVQGYGNKVWSQMAFGQIKVKGGSLAQDYALPQIFIRNRDSNGWKAWQNIIDIQDATTSKSGLMSAADKVMLGIIRQNYINAGATYNAATGYYSLNGLTDITEEQMAVIYSEGRIEGADLVNKKVSTKARTFLPLNTYGSYYRDYDGDISLYNFARDSNNLEVVVFSTKGSGSPFYATDIRGMFYGDTKLKRVEYLDLSKCTKNQFAFGLCDALETVNISGLKTSLNLQSPVISYDSLRFLVDHAANTTAITVTVDVHVWNWLTGVSAPPEGHTSQEWQAINSDAVAKNISFAY